MHKKLILEAFKKAEKERLKIGVRSPSITTLAEDISDYMYNHIGFNLGDKSFRNYRNKALRTDKDQDIDIKQFKVVIGLCNYLGFETYQEFLKSLNNYPVSGKEIKMKSGVMFHVKKRKSTLIIALASVILGMFIFPI